MSVVNLPRTPSQSPGDGGNGHGGEPPMEARLASLEANMTHVVDDIRDIKADIRAARDGVNELQKEIHHEFTNIRSEMKTDFRWLLAGGIALAGLMTKGFHWF